MTYSCSCRGLQSSAGVMEDHHLLLLKQHSRDAAGLTSKEGFAKTTGPFAKHALCVQLFLGQFLVRSVTRRCQWSLVLRFGSSVSGLAELQPTQNSAKV